MIDWIKETLGKVLVSLDVALFSDYSPSAFEL